MSDFNTLVLVIVLGVVILAIVGAGTFLLIQEKQIKRLRAGGGDGPRQKRSVPATEGRRVSRGRRAR